MLISNPGGSFTSPRGISLAPPTEWQEVAESIKAIAASPLTKKCPSFISNDAPFALPHR
jgi:hypothetical protein